MVKNRGMKVEENTALTVSPAGVVAKTFAVNEAARSHSRSISFHIRYVKKGGDLVHHVSDRYQYCVFSSGKLKVSSV